MSSIVRLLIVWLLLLAVPFQVVAAAALPCEAAVAAPAMPMAAQVHHDHARMMMHDGAMAQKAASDHAGHHATLKCGTCAACWVCPAIAGAVPGVGPQPPSSAAIPFDAGHIPTVHLSLPERPPRSALA